LMPSRVEPCGLNQMYAMRYGTVPVVSYTGGLRDTVKDISTGGSGLNFTYPGVDDVVHSMVRGLAIYNQKKAMEDLVLSNMNFDFAWENSAEKYIALYQK